MKQYYLFLETLQDTLNLMLMDESFTLIEHFTRDTHQNMLETIIDDLQTLLNHHHLTPSHITRLYWVSHPGLYTGMRIGSLIAKAWTTNQSTSIYEINKLHLQATNDCISLIDAKSHQYYGQIFVNSVAINPLSVINEDELQQWIKAYPHLTVIHDSVSTYEGFIKHHQDFKPIDISKYHLPYFKPPC